MPDEEWITVREAAQVRNCSERYILKLIAQNAIKAKKDGRKWMVLIEGSELVRNGADTGSDTGIQVANKTTNIRTSSGSGSPELVRMIKQQLEEKNEEVKYLREQLEQRDFQIETIQKSADDARERSDTIIMQLTRQLGDSQKALEAHTRPWWRRLRLNKGKDKRA